MKNSTDNLANMLLTQLTLLGQVLVVLIIIWVLIYLRLTYYFIKRFRAENPTLWQQMGSPTLFKNNGALYRFIFGNHFKKLNENIQVYGRLLRYMTYLGVTLVISAIAVLFVFLVVN